MTIAQRNEKRKSYSFDVENAGVSRGLRAVRFSFCVSLGYD